jgi:hypothetical protein
MTDISHMVSVSAPASELPRVKSVSLPPFDSLTDTAALEYIRRRMPTRLQFVMPDSRGQDRHVVSIDYTWIMQISEDLWWRDIHDEVMRRLQQGVDLFVSAVDTDAIMEMMCGKPLDQWHVNMANEALRRQDLEREFQREPTFMQLLKHGIGLESCGLFSSLHVEIESHMSHPHTVFTADYFKKCVGRAPTGDDLQRANCKDSGTLGHWACGWCFECDRPRFVCGHYLRKP